MTYRDELIQVTAVAVAMVEDFDHGSTAITERQGPGIILSEVIEERWRQENKWGPQHHDPAVWLAILMEEVGEAAQAALKELIDPKAEAAAAQGSQSEDTDAD